MRNISAIIYKEFIHILRDRKTLVLVILMPIMQLLIYGFGVNTDVKHLRTYVYDQDQTYLSRRLVDAFVQSDYFSIAKKASSMG